MRIPAALCAVALLLTLSDRSATAQEKAAPKRENVKWEYAEYVLPNTPFTSCGQSCRRQRSASQGEFDNSPVDDWSR